MNMIKNNKNTMNNKITDSTKLEIVKAIETINEEQAKALLRMIKSFN